MGPQAVRNNVHIMTIGKMLNFPDVSEPPIEGTYLLSRHCPSIEDVPFG